MSRLCLARVVKRAVVSVVLRGWEKGVRVWVARCQIRLAWWMARFTALVSAGGSGWVEGWGSGAVGVWLLRRSVQKESRASWSSLIDAGEMWGLYDGASLSASCDRSGHDVRCFVAPRAGMSVRNTFGKSTDRGAGSALSR